MAFASMKMNPNNMVQYELHEQYFYEDFQKCLSEVGFLPEINVNNTVELLKKIKELERQLAKKSK